MRILLIAALTIGALSAQGPRRAPGFALADSKGQLHDLYDYRGKIVLIEFMQTTCPHCAAFAGILQKVQQKYGDKLAILAVSNPPDNATTVTQYIAGHKITYPVLFDMGQMAYSYILKGSVDLPQVFLVDANGMIFNQYGYSPMTRDVFEGNGLFNELDRMLATASAPAKAPAKK